MRNCLKWWKSCWYELAVPLEQKMRTEPAIPLKQIRQYINEYYHTHIDTLEFLPIGEGAWCFHGKGDLDLFIRLVKDPPAKETLYLSQFLHDQGLPVVSVLPDKSGEFISNIGKGGIIVYPFIHGTSLMKSSVKSPMKSWNNS